MQLNHYPLANHLQKGGDALKLINTRIADAFTAAGFARIDTCDHTERSERERVPLDPSADLGPGIGIHRRWRWELEWIDDEWWVAPLPSYRFLVEADRESLRLLENAIAHDLHVMSFDGRRGRVERIGRDWVVNSGKGQVSATASNWYVTLRTEDLEELGHSGRAHQANQLDFARAGKAVVKSAIAPLLRTCSVRQVDGERSHACDGRRLLFGRGASAEMKHVLKYGVRAAPTEEIVFAMCHEAYKSTASARPLRDRWLCLLLPETKMRKERREYPRVAKADVRDVWDRIGMPRYDIPRGAVVEYDQSSGEIPKADVERLSLLAGGRRLVTAAFVRNEMAGDVFRAVADNFRNVGKTLMLTPTTLDGNPNIYANVALELAEKAGARLWDLDLPAAPAGTYFLGFDSGQTPERSRQRGSFTLVGRNGSQVGTFDVELDSRSERVTDRLLKDDVRRWLRRSARDMTRLIVHRDGNFLSGEDEAFLSLASAETTSLVAIRKSTNSRFSNEATAGFWWRASPDRALLVTNDQANKVHGRPTPLDIRLVRSAGLELDDAVAQIFWLTRVFRGSMFHPRRVPVTISISDAHAATGITSRVRQYL